MKLSDQDRRILRQLQHDAARSLAEIAQACDMAQSTLWRRLQDLEASGVILGRVALLDASKVDTKLCVLASISLHDHTEDAIEAFTSLVRTHSEILECHAVSGGADYMLKIRTTDVETYEQFMSQNLLRSPHIRSVVSSFVLKEIKATTALPI